MLKYTNKKTGNEYYLLREGTDRTNARDGLVVAIYTRVSDWEKSAFLPDEIHIREMGEFLEKFELTNDTTV